MSYRNNQINMTHALPAYLLLGYLYSASVANNTLVADTLVLSAVAFVIPYRTENPFAEKAIALGFVCSIVNRFRFKHFPA